jgi:hypothetical protein
MSLKGTIKGLSAIKAKAAEKTSFTGDGESPFLTLKDGETAVIRFLQELDDESALYDDRRGLVEVVEEHTSPKDFKLRAVCTYESENRCYACEQTTLPEIGKKWKPRMRFYANVILRAEGGDKVKILAQGFSAKNIGSMLIDMAEEYENLGGQDFKLSRKGAGMNDTSYSLLPRPAKAMSKADQELEVIDLSKFIKYVPYEQQAEFYAGNAKEETAGKESWVN